MGRFESAFQSTGPAQVEFLDEALVTPARLRPVAHIRCASYNVHNLFGEAPDVNTRRQVQPASEEQLEALGEMIGLLDADVIAFQEVQNEWILKDVFRRFVNPRRMEAGLERMTTFISPPSGDARGINVALATRLAARASISFRDREFETPDGEAQRFSRGVLGVELFATPRYRFMVFVAHLKSQIGGEPSHAKRRVEAAEIRSIIESPVFGGEAFVQGDFVLAGDMNEGPDGGAVTILRGRGDPETDLCDVLADVQPNHSYPATPGSRYRPQRLDYLFTSPSMTRRIIPGSATIHRDDPPASEASDHYPVSVDLRVVD